MVAGSRVVKGLVMSESGLPDRDTRGILSLLGLADSAGCLDETWLRKSGGYGGWDESEYKPGGDLHTRVSSLLLGEPRGFCKCSWDYQE